MTISMTPAKFADRLRGILTEVHGPLPPAHGATATDLERVADWFANPSILRTCYEVAGCHKALTHGFACLIPCNQLLRKPRDSDRYETEIGGLIFMTEQKESAWYTLILEAQ